MAVDSPVTYPSGTTSSEILDAIDIAVSPCISLRDKECNESEPSLRTPPIHPCRPWVLLLGESDLHSGDDTPVCRPGVHLRSRCVPAAGATRTKPLGLASHTIPEELHYVCGGNLLALSHSLHYIVHCLGVPWLPQEEVCVLGY